MTMLKVPEPLSGGLILSYKCSSECKHCMYFGSPNWSNDWISEEDLKSILTKLSKRIQPSPYGSRNVSLNYGLHFTGGEPFLNYDVLLKSVKIGETLGIPSQFVETNCYWCKNDEVTRDKLIKLKSNGLEGILISVNPFILEHVPFERTERAIRISREVFNKNFMVYQLYYFHQFKELNFKDTVPIEKYLSLISIEELKRRVELFRMGRAAYKLQDLYENHPISYFFNENCASDLIRNWHCHFDNKGNYIPGYCGGISWGDVRELDSLCTDGIELDDFPILNALIEKKLKDLFLFAKRNFNYKELTEGYISKCHACFDIRKAITSSTNEFKELKPREFYFHV